MTDPDGTDKNLMRHIFRTAGEFGLAGGTKLVRVFFVGKDGRLFEELHVDDPTTLAETVAMSLARSHARWAVWPDGTLWALTGGGRTRHYPSKEAAEMVAIHRG
jgi:hypothetical protein